LLKFILLLLSYSFILNANEVIKIPIGSKLIEITFRYVDNGDKEKVQKITTNITILEKYIILSLIKSSEDDIIAEIDVENKQELYALVLKYIDNRGNTRFKTKYYDDFFLENKSSLYMKYSKKQYSNSESSNQQSSNQKYSNQDYNKKEISNTDNQQIISGFNIIDDKSNKNKYNSRNQINFYTFKQVKNIIHNIKIENFLIKDIEQHFCTIPIKSSISYFVNKKDLFFIFKDFELSSDIIVNKAQIILKFAQENKFKTCNKTNIDRNIINISSAYHSANNGELWLVSNFKKSIKSISIVYPKNMTKISNYNQELKDVVIYKIEMN